MTFFRIATDHTRTPLPLDGLYAAAPRSTCWIVGGGPSLADAPLDAIAASPAPTFAVNLAGSRRLRPTFWTAYDATARFHRSTYQDAGTLKFLAAGRATDLVPETTLKVGDMPGAVFFETEPGRGYADWLRSDGPLVDWADSLVQAIAIAVRLGFRRLLLVGCDLHVRPSPGMLAIARRRGVGYVRRDRLADFVTRCEEAGIPRATLAEASRPRLYHFDEDKPLEAAIRTDEHYFRVSQSLRLCRRSLATAGVELVSATPISRLNDCFPTATPSDLIADLAAELGDRTVETERGRYARDEPRLPPGLGPMQDVPPFVRAGAARPLPV